MRFLTTIIASFLFFVCFAQTKEVFFNSVYGTIVDSSYTKYYLYSDSHPLTIISTSYSMKKFNDELSKFIPIETINELIDNAYSDTLELNWDCSKLKLADCIINGDSILMKRMTVHLNDKWWWSKRKRNRETDKQVAEQRKRHNSKPKQDRIIFSISRPVFDCKKEFALIQMWYSCGNLCGSGCIYLFKKEENHWVLLTRTECYVS